MREGMGPAPDPNGMLFTTPLCMITASPVMFCGTADCVVPSAGGFTGKIELSACANILVRSAGEEAITGSGGRS